MDLTSQQLEGVTDRHAVVILGLGGGGCNTVGRLAEHWPEAPEIIAVHTDSQVLAACPAPRRILIGEQTANGRSTGGDVEMGRGSVLEDETKLRVLFEDVNVVYLVAALGGGTGTGGAPELARIAREEGALVVCFATLPFEFEGIERSRAADLGLVQLRENAHAVVCLPNDRLLDMQGGRVPLLEAFLQIDERVCGCLRALWDLMARPGLINLNFGDILQLVRHSGGTCAFAYAEASGAERAEITIEQILHSPLLDRGNSLAQAEGLLVGLTGGPDMTLGEVGQVMREIRAVCNHRVRILFGTAIDPAAAGDLRITVLASEKWLDGVERTAPLPGMDHLAPEQEFVKPAEGRAEAEPVRPSARGAKFEQVSLNLEPTGKGRFKDVEPTFHEGQDLDIPTFMRRGIRLG